MDMANEPPPSSHNQQLQILELPWISSHQGFLSVTALSSSSFNRATSASNAATLCSKETVGMAFQHSDVGTLIIPYTEGADYRFTTGSFLSRLKLTI